MIQVTYDAWLLLHWFVMTSILGCANPAPPEASQACFCSPVTWMCIPVISITPWGKLTYVMFRLFMEYPSWPHLYGFRSTCQLGCTPKYKISSGKLSTHRYLWASPCEVASAISKHWRSEEKTLEICGDGRPPVGCFLIASSPSPSIHWTTAMLNRSGFELISINFQTTNLQTTHLFRSLALSKTCHLVFACPSAHCYSHGFVCVCECQRALELVNIRRKHKSLTILRCSSPNFLRDTLQETTAKIYVRGLSWTYFTYINNCGMFTIIQGFGTITHPCQTCYLFNPGFW